MTLEEINALDADGFVAALGAIYEHSPWVAQRAWAQRPFHTLDALAAAMQAAVDAAPRAEQLTLLRAHPELASRAAIAGELTAHSTAEQGGAGLTACSPAEFARLQHLNAEYGRRFGFPFIIAVKGHSRASIIAAFEARLDNDRDTEFATALRQVARIARLRLDALAHQDEAQRGPTHRTKAP